MLRELADENETLGQMMNKLNTQIMMETDTPIYGNTTQIEKIETYVYLAPETKLIWFHT